jgi:hypothetical protein
MHTTISLLSPPPSSFLPMTLLTLSILTDLEWKVTYVGSATKTKDQVLDEILVGPVPVGVNKFVLQADPSNPIATPRKYWASRGLGHVLVQERDSSASGITSITNIHWPWRKVCRHRRIHLEHDGGATTNFGRQAAGDQVSHSVGCQR